eukprot:TRINITY_DN1701_c0_g1_i1.p1 TRINITY_DN1701_c0_g1~~TRINITY_DN1701_c0_g1_i1.p1  ORF type:complete len:158 (-),score=33.56 TRINITY_DN1701_c0_g1_i1:25-498(-)
MQQRQTAIGAACWVPVAIAFHDHCFAIRTVNSAAMQPSLQPGEMVAEGPPDRVLLDKISARKNWLYRGDAVIMSSPVSPGSSYATRIVGLEGDWVQPSTRQGLVHVPKGHCWVQHDNMELSLIHISEPTRLLSISYAVFCLKKKKKTNKKKRMKKLK